MAIKVVDVCHVAPSEGAADEQLLPLLNFDIVRLRNNFPDFLFFFSSPCTESHFLDTLVPHLMESLSLTLKHFLPLSGNIVFPLRSNLLPVSHFVVGDSVTLTIAVSNSDFDRLTGNQSRDSDEFHDFIPPMPLPFSCSEFMRLPVLAIQVTLFPNKGIAIGLTMHHAIIDGGTTLRFMQAWSSTTKFNGDDHLLALGDNFLPFYDRNISGEANDLAIKAWNYMKNFKPAVASAVSLPTYRVRATFTVNQAEIGYLKTSALNKKPAMAKMTSSLVLLCGHVWSCLAKAAAAVGEEVAGDEPEFLTCTANIRGMMNPPLPSTYFGNCTVLLLAESTHGTLSGKEGFVAAANTVGEAIHNIKNKSDNVFDDLEQRLKLKGKRVLTIAGSPRFELYDIDYGWGKTKKFEYIANDCDGSVFLCQSKEEGKIEIGMSLPKAKMDAFAAFFNQGLRDATESLHLISSL